MPLSRVRKLDSSTEQTKDGGTLYSPIPSLFMNKKIKIIIGLGQKRKHYHSLSKHLNIREVDWNNGSLSKMRLGRPKILIGFSLGCMVAIMHAEKYRVKTLILCSPSPEETLLRVKADQVIFLVGEKENWCLKEIKRMSRTLRCRYSIIVIRGANHRITGDYQKKLVEVIQSL